MIWVEQTVVELTNQTAIKWRAFKCLWRVCDHLKCRQKLNRAQLMWSRHTTYAQTYVFNGSYAVAHTYLYCRDHLHQTLQLYTQQKKTRNGKNRKAKSATWSDTTIPIYVYICMFVHFFTLSLYLKIIEHNSLCRWMKKFTSPI